MKLIFYMNKQNKNLKILRSERSFRWNKKHFSSFLKGIQLPEIVSDLRVDFQKRLTLMDTVTRTLRHNEASLVLATCNYVQFS